MKKLSGLMALVMMFSLLAGAFGGVTVAAPGYTIQSFSADVYGVVIGESETVTFEAQINAHNLNNVAVYDDAGNLVTYLNETTPGVYVGSKTLFADAKNRTTYHVEVGNQKFGSHEIRYYTPLTDADIARNEFTWENITKIQDDMEAVKASNDAIFDAVYDYLLTDSDVESVWWQNDTTINFDTYSGISNVFTIFDENTKGGEVEIEADVPVEIIDEKNNNNYIGSADIGIFCPYYGADGNFSFNYYQAGQAVIDDLGGTLTGYYGNGTPSYQGIDMEACGVTAFQNVDQYGVVMIDSHGADYMGGGCICVPYPGTYDNTDLSEGHLVNGGGWIGVRGSYIAKYCDPLPNTITYIGICYGMAAEHLWQPMLEAGGGICYGYDDSVTFAWDGIMVADILNVFASVNPDTGRQYTGGEVFDYLRELNGSVDPYGTAVFVCEGNMDIVMSAVAIPLEDVTLDPATATMYTNNTLTLTPVLTPIDANRCSYEWTSSDESVATVDENGVVTAGQAGTATITCTVTDTSDEENPSIFTATSEITVNGIMDVAGINIEEESVTLYTGTTLSLNAQVIPENASNQNINWFSSNTDVVTVEDGVLTPVGVGMAVVTAMSADGGHMDTCVVTVVAGDLNAALNVTGGALNFTTGTRAWTVDYDGERMVGRSGNSGINDSTSTITLNAGVLPAGTVVKFDWKVSSEASYDKLSFKANNNAVAGISDISGVVDWQSKTYMITQERDYTLTWSYSKDYSVGSNEDCGWVDNVEIIIPGATYTVEFLDWDGTVLSTQTVAHGEAAIAPEDPYREGYTFVGWDRDFSAIRSDLTVNAFYIGGEGPQLPTYTVTFYDWNGEVLASETVTAGGSATPPADPYRDGYIFLGWDGEYTDVQSNVDVYAVYGLFGDANGDDDITIGDAAYILRYVINLVDMTPEQLQLVDINDDGVVNTGDAAALLSLLMVS